MRIAYATHDDPTDIKAWSGLRYYIAKSLAEQSLTLDYLGPFTRELTPWVIAKSYFYYRFSHKRYLLDFDPAILKNYAKQVATKLANIKADIIFSNGLIPTACLETTIPGVFWVDATFPGLINFYPDHSNLCRESIKNALAIEADFLNRCRLAIYASEWAAQTAIDSYQVQPSKVKVVPFGANVECHRTLEDIRALVQQRLHNRCNLLFVGVDWLRKGGDIALDVAKALNQAGIETKLTVVGCQPPNPETLPAFVHVVGFVDKSTSEGKAQLDQLFSRAHFLILPSRAEAYGLVLCEANSFGVPCLASNVGGIPTIVQDNVNGKTFALDGAIEDYCTFVTEVLSDHKDYMDLAISSFHQYESRLNWGVAGKTVKRLLTDLL